MIPLFSVKWQGIQSLNNGPTLTSCQEEILSVGNEMKTWSLAFKCNLGKSYLFLHVTYGSLNFFLYKCFSNSIICTLLEREMRCSADSEILHWLVHDTSWISSCFSDFREVLRTYLCGITQSLLHFSFLTL